MAKKRVLAKVGIKAERGELVYYKDGTLYAVEAKRGGTKGAKRKCSTTTTPAKKKKAAPKKRTAAKKTTARKKAAPKKRTPVKRSKPAGRSAVKKSDKFKLRHIQVVADILGKGAAPVHIQWRNGKDEWVSKKRWEEIKDKYNWTTDF